MDFDADGIKDVIAGSIYEDVYLFRGLGKGRFAKRKLLRDKDNNPIKGGYCCTTELLDMDADGDLDLVCANRISRAKWFENIGTRSAPRFDSKALSLPMEKGAGSVSGSNAAYTDWDGDGKRDLVVGSEYGRIVWHRNVGQDNQPKFSGARQLLKDPGFERIEEGDIPKVHGSRAKVFIVDYDNDGLRDILLGDFTSCTYNTRAPLTKAEKKEKKDLEAQLAQLRDQAYYDEVNQLNRELRELTQPIKDMQKALNARIKPSPNLLVDGDFGPKTITALKQFQQQNKLKATGQLDEGSQKALGLLNLKAENLEKMARLKARQEEMSLPGDAIYKKLRPYRTTGYKSHGWVWFYRQLPQAKVNLAREVLTSKPAAQTQEVTLRTLASHTQVAPGQEFQVALSFQIAKDWHIYGPKKGDTYLPTAIDWKLPKGTKLKDVKWPKPHLVNSGGSVQPTYEGTVTVLATFIAPRNAKVNSKLKLTAEVSWQVCQELVCKLGEATIKTSIRIGKLATRETTSASTQ